MQSYTVSMSDLFQSVFQSAFDGMILLDPVREGVRACNPQACQILGLTEQALKGLSWKQLLPKQTDLWRQIHRQVVQGRKGMMRLVDLQTESGKPKRLEMTASAVDQGVEVLVLLVLRDPQSRQQADSNMARLNQLYSLLSVTNRVLSSCETRTDLFESICEAAVLQGGFRMAWVGISNDTHIVPVATAGHVAGYLRNIRIELTDELRSKGPVALANKLGEPRIINNIRSDESFAPWRDEALARGFFSMVAMPVLLKGQVVAVLALYSAIENDFDHRMIEVLKDICNDITLGLRHIDDETNRAENESKLRQLYKAVESSATAVIITDSTGVIEYVNPQFVQMMGYSPTEVIGLTPEEMASHEVQQIGYDEMRKILLAGQEWRGEWQNRTRDGKLIWTYQHVSPIRDEAGRITHFVSTAIDHTDLHFARETIERLAYYDELTGLPNRRLFYDRLQHAIDSTQRDDVAFGVCFLDLDGFKTINDSMGHEAGDLLLKAVAQRLKQCVRAKDTVARLGGDEFTVILRDIKDPHDITVVAEHIIHALSRPVSIQDAEVVVTTSIGIALYPDDGREIGDLTRNADIAMYHAKGQGKNNFQFFTAELNQRVQKRLQLEIRLRRAFEHREFRLLYQPQFDAVDGAVMGLEAKIYWESEEGTLTPPTEFWAVLEESGLVVDVVLWAIERALIESSGLIEKQLPDLLLSFDISARHLRHVDTFIQQLERIVKRTGGKMKNLLLEVPESALGKDAEGIIRRLRQLKQKGVKLALDHFGTGSSSLRMLRHFPVDLIKIDSSFVADVLHDENDAAVTAAILALAHQLELKVLAEGVATARHVQFLERYWCDCLQGDYYCKDVSMAQIHKFLEQYLSQYG